MPVSPDIEPEGRHPKSRTEEEVIKKRQDQGDMAFYLRQPDAMHRFLRYTYQEPCQRTAWTNTYFLTEY